MYSIYSEAKECICSRRPCYHLTDVSVSDPERDRHRVRQTDRHRGGQEHEGCFIGMFLDSICLLNSGLWYCFMS